jgi:hypothetical protein
MKKNAELYRQRNSLLHGVEQTLDGPMIFMGFLWVVLLVMTFYSTFSLHHKSFLTKKGTG